MYVSRLLCRWLFTSLCKVFNNSLWEYLLLAGTYVHIYIYLLNMICVHTCLLKTLHSLVNSDLYSRSDYLYMYVSRLLCRWVIASLCKVFNSSLWEYLLLAGIYVHVYIYLVRMICVYICPLKTTHRFANSYLCSKSDYLYIYVARLLCRWVFTSLCVFFNRHVFDIIFVYSSV